METRETRQVNDFPEALFLHHVIIRYSNFVNTIREKQANQEKFP